MKYIQKFILIYILNLLSFRAPSLVQSLGCYYPSLKSGADPVIGGQIPREAT